MLGKQGLSGLIKATALLALSFLLPAAGARADVVTNLSPDWVIVAGSLSPTGGIWALPASSANCGNENELTCEPTGTFVFDHPITATKGYVTITDQTGRLATTSCFQITVLAGTVWFSFTLIPIFPLI